MLMKEWARSRKETPKQSPSNPPILASNSTNDWKRWETVFVFINVIMTLKMVASFYVTCTFTWTKETIVSLTWTDYFMINSSLLPYYPCCFGWNRYPTITSTRPIFSGLKPAMDENLPSYPSQTFHLKKAVFYSYLSKTIFKLGGCYGRVSVSTETTLEISNLN